MEDTKLNSNKKPGAPNYWLSLEQWRQDPEFIEKTKNEFSQSPLSNVETESGWARREFLKLMGASLALTTFGCVRRPAQKIVPYVNRPEEVVPGIANYYSSTMIEGHETFGLVVKTREGRPIKIEGNPDHPDNQGGLSASAHAALLSLYDPDRLVEPKRNILNKNKTNADMISTTYEKIDEAVSKAVKKGSVAVVTQGQKTSASKQFFRDFTRATKSQLFFIDSVDETTVKRGQRASYGKSVFPRYQIQKARLIVSVGADFLGTYVTPVSFSKQFSKRRNPDGDMNKLISFESVLSLTGANADERFQVKPTQKLTAVMAILSDLIIKKGRTSYSADRRVVRALKSFDEAIKALHLPEGAISRITDELWSNRGKSLVLSGGMQSKTSKALELQVATNFLNSVLGNDGKTIDYSQASQRGFDGGAENVNKLVSAINSGKIKTLIVQGTNLAYFLPETSGFKEAIKKLDLIVYLGDRNDETGRISDYIVPDHHQFETWGDSEGLSGVYAIQQPTIRPLYKTRAFQESLMKWANLSGMGPNRFKEESWYKYLQEHWKYNIWSKNRSVSFASQSFDDFWYELLQKGVFDTSRTKRSRSTGARNFNISQFSKISPSEEHKWELALYQKSILKDGALANMAWLQELPDPVTKLVWDNYVCISVQDAQAQHIKEGQVLNLKVGSTSVSIPAHIQPGQKSGVLALAVGYGRKGAGKVADGIGVNAYQLAQYNANEVAYSGLPVEFSSTSDYVELVTPQGHHSMEGRQIAIEATHDQYKHNKEANIHRHKIFSLWDKHEYKGHKWGMSIDLNTCNGCSACVVACQAENNIPVVGKKYVMEGRIMQWIRVDRYYSGDPNDPSILNMPITCHHCDNAPCETVCPVAATTHSDEGLNTMTYNRCVGTRYCGNNCPYKVRRFNWFNYTKDIKKPLNMALNPEVTVRVRGVMEKCSFCEPRIKSAKEKAKQDGRALKDGDILTACQQSCPADAIVFGDMNDPNSKLSQMFSEKRTYSLLEELNAVPALKYQTKIRNTDKLKTENSKKDQGGH